MNHHRDVLRKEHTQETIRELRRKAMTYQQAKKAVELFDEEWIGQNSKKLWEWAVSKALSIEEEDKP